MPQTTPRIPAQADYLDHALRTGTEVERLSLQYPDLTLEEAYLIQDEGIRRRYQRDEKPLGFKMGFTSEAKRKQMNLGSPIYGILTDRMALPHQGTFSLTDTSPRPIHPKIEPEIAFRISQTLHGEVTREQVLDACSGVCPALEILDSRYTGFKYFSLPDVVADNCSSAWFVLGETWYDPHKIDVRNLSMVMKINGEIAEQASSDAISGDPVQSVIQLCELLASRGLSLPASSIVLAGAATAAVALKPGMEVELTVDQLGTALLSIR